MKNPIAAKIKQRAEPRKCLACDEDFAVTRIDKMFCSDTCRARYAHLKKTLSPEELRTLAEIESTRRKPKFTPTEQEQFEKSLDLAHILKD